MRNPGSETGVEALDMRGGCSRGDELEGQFDTIARMMYEITRVNLTEGKRELVKARISKLMRGGRWETVRDYVAFVKSERGHDERKRMVDALTTNKTNFFRESVHFDFLSATVLPELTAGGRSINIWSAGCSSGEEPYTLAMVVREKLGAQADRLVRILATDISDPVLSRARSGVYGSGHVDGIPRALLEKYFTVGANERGQAVHQVRPAIRSLVTLARLNLMTSWPMAGPLDVIMCRNVMIYFDRPTRAHLVEKFCNLLPEGGYLFVGHSESLNGIPHGLEYVQPAVYRR